MALPKCDGVILIEVLELLKEKVTLETIILKVAELVKCCEDDLRKSVVEVLNAGVHYGFVRCRNHKYSIMPVKPTLHYGDIDNCLYSTKHLACVAGDLKHKQKAALGLTKTVSVQTLSTCSKPVPLAKIRNERILNLKRSVSYIVHSMHKIAITTGKKIKQSAD